jgi:hypothetical protein
MIEGESIVRMAPDNARSGPPEGDSETIPATPRRALIDALAKAVRAGAATGDMRLVRVAARILIELTGDARTGAAGIDFVREPAAP